MKVLEGDGDAEEVPKKGLIGLPFMQKAMQKQKEQNQTEAQKMLREIDGVKEPEEDRAVKTRMQFGGSIDDKETSPSDSEKDDSPARLQGNAAPSQKSTREGEKCSSVVDTP